MSIWVSQGEGDETTKLDLCSSLFISQIGYRILHCELIIIVFRVETLHSWNFRLFGPQGLLLGRYEWTTFVEIQNFRVFPDFEAAPLLVSEV